jgi:hypothetical protein
MWLHIQKEGEALGHYGPGPTAESAFQVPRAHSHASWTRAFLDLRTNPQYIRVTHTEVVIWEAILKMVNSWACLKALL